MEVDWSATDECKEGGDGALLRAGEPDVGDSTDFLLQPPHGQMQMARLRQLPPSCNQH